MVGELDGWVESWMDGWMPLGKQQRLHQQKRELIVSPASMNVVRLSE